MNDYLIRYVLDGHVRAEIFVADDEEEALHLFRRVHPALRVVSIERCLA